MESSETHNAHLAFLSGGGALGTLIAAFDWTATPLGPISGWEQCLKTAVSIVLRCNVPMVILWGPDGIMIYNDAYADFAAARHPFLLGSKVREGWPEAADFNDHVMKVVLAGSTLAFRDQELTLLRTGTPEKVWLNLDYSPVLDTSGEPAGVIAILVDTSDKVAAELWQASERDRQRQMFEQAPGFMAILSGPEHVFELTNAAYMQLVGHRDVLGLPVREALPEIEAQSFFELLDHVYQSGERFIGHAMRARIQRTPTGTVEERFIDLVYQPVRNLKNEVIGIFVQGSDVTDRLIAEDALRQSEAQFRALAESLPNHVWTATPDGLLNWFNQRVYDYSGNAPGELDGQNWAQIIHPEDLDRAVEAWQSALVSGYFYETEFRIRRHDGAYRWHIAQAVLIRDADGAFVQWIGTNTDIDDLKIVTKKLEESDRRMQLSQNAAGISSIELDIDTGTVFGSEGFWDLWGLPKGESIQISTLENLVIADDKDIRSNDETRKNGTAAPNVEYRIRRADTGELRWLSRHVEFAHDQNGRPVKMYGVMQDVTARKESEARQKMLTHELEHRIKNTLATVSAIASQTFRNTDIDTGRTVFNERLRALAKAHDLLNDTRWTEASMVQVISSTIAVFPSDQISISGPPIWLSPRMALALALAVNELGTNALKYGALSTPAGSVTIAWSLSDPGPAGDSTLTWRWVEEGGPAVAPPTRRGFGTFLVETMFANDFEGSVQLSYHPEGMECVLTAPTPEISATALSA